MIQSITGVVTLLVVAWLMSEKRQIIPWRTILAGVALQVAIAVSPAPC